jgi:hypothetical protein
MRKIPPADQIEIVHAEDPPPLPRGPLPDETPLSELYLTGRPRSVLKAYRRFERQASGAIGDDWGMPVILATVGDLRRESDYSLLAQQNCGRKSLKELREACGDAFPHDRKLYPQTLTEALGKDKAEIVIAMRSVAGNLYRLANLIEQAGRRGSL